MNYYEYLKTPEWKQKRLKVLEYWSGRCILCNSDQRVTVHHRTYERLGNELITDLVPLCEVCHTKLHLTIIQSRQVTLQQVQNTRAAGLKVKVD
jgi:hypothetical protein